MKIITFYSQRGGVGKTTIVASLANAMALQGKRVAMIDFDLISPGLNMLLDASSPKVTITDILLSGENASPNFTPEELAGSAVGPGRLYVIPCRSDELSIARILRDGYPASRLRSLFDFLEQTLKLDYVLIDTHSGLEEDTLLAVSTSDAVIIVTRIDPQNLFSLRIASSVLRKLKQQALVVVNMVPQSENQRNHTREIEQNCSLPVAGTIPFYQDIFEQGGRGIIAPDQVSHEMDRKMDDIIRTLEVVELA